MEVIDVNIIGKHLKNNNNYKDMLNPFRIIGRYWNLLAAWGGTDWYLSDLERDDPEKFQHLADEIMNGRYEIENDVDRMLVRNMHERFGYSRNGA